MSDQRPETLDRLLDDVAVRPAPLSEMVAQGRARKTRRRRWAIAGWAVAAVVAIGGGVLALQSVSSPDRAGSDQVFADGTEKAPTSADLAVVGTGRVVIDVPRAWTEDGRYSLCTTTSGDFVSFASPPGCPEVSATGVSSVLVRPWGPSTLDVYEPAQTVAEVDGYEVLADPVRCDGGEGETEAAVCTQRFGIDALDASFTVTVREDDGGRETVDAIRESLRVLPTTQVAVPAPLDSDLDVFTATLRDAGLTVATIDGTCPDTADCVLGVTGVSPRPGTVVETGSVVTVMALG